MHDRLTPILILSLVVAGLALSAPTAAQTEAETDPPKTANVTLRVAPDGFVVPSHPFVGNEAHWVIDPVEEDRFNDWKGVAGCHLTVPDTDEDDRVDGTEVLDNATDTGCILGWDSEHDPGLGELVTAVDGRESHGPTTSGWPGAWWIIQENGRAAPTGVSGMNLEDGDAISFVYHVGA